MNKEKLDRIKAAYYSGLKVQIWFYGRWNDFDVMDYSMYPDPFSENRQYRIVGSEYAEEVEKQVEELEKDKDYFSDALDKQIEATLKLDQMYQKQKEINKELVDELEEVKEDRNYARSIIADLLRNSDEYARIRASEYLHG